MEFNESKYELLKHGINTDLKKSCNFCSIINATNNEEEGRRDLGITMQKIVYLTNKLEWSRLLTEGRVQRP